MNDYTYTPYTPYVPTIAQLQERVALDERYLNAAREDVSRTTSALDEAIHDVALFAEDLRASRVALEMAKNKQRAARGAVLDTMVKYGYGGDACKAVDHVLTQHNGRP